MIYGRAPEQTAFGVANHEGDIGDHRLRPGIAVIRIHAGRKIDGRHNRTRLQAQFLHFGGHCSQGFTQRAAGPDTEQAIEQYQRPGRILPHGRSGECCFKSEFLPFLAGKASAIIDGKRGSSRHLPAMMITQNAHGHQGIARVVTFTQIGHQRAGVGKMPCDRMAEPGAGKIQQAFLTPPCGHGGGLGGPHRGTIHGSHAGKLTLRPADCRS